MSMDGINERFEVFGVEVWIHSMTQICYQSMCVELLQHIFGKSANFFLQKETNGIITRMHFSRMRTGRSLTVCWSLLPGGGGVSAPGGCLFLGGGIPACTEAHPPPDRITDTSKNNLGHNFVAAGNKREACYQVTWTNQKSMIQHHRQMYKCAA